ncbi:inositol phosphorylceramide synthase, partial [Streptomyces sp. NPDC127574]
LLLSYRWLPVQMAAHPWLAGPLLLLAMGSVIHSYVRTTTSWEPGPAPAPRPTAPQPELI